MANKRNMAVEYDSRQNMLDSEDKDASLVPVNNLPDDCLIEIFSLLPFIDRIRIQRVCKRWRDINRLSWHNHKVLSLDTYEWKYKRGSTLDLSFLRNVLELCGRFVTHVSFADGLSSNYFFNVNEEFFRLISEQCPNMTSIYIECVYPETKCIKYLAEMHTNLTSFFLTDCFEENLEQSLALLFRRNKKLRRICIQFSLDANCWLHLNPEAVEEISIMGDYEPTDVLCTAFKGFKNLQKFMAEDWLKTNLSMHINDFLKAIASHAGSLKHLVLECISSLVEVQHVCYFLNLEKLYLNKVKIDNQFFEAVCRNCTNLMYVKIKDLKNVTKVDLKSIAKLPKLQILHIQAISENLDELFNHGLLHLKKLHCIRCYGLEFSTVCKFLRESTSLKYLQISNCHNICTSSLINVAKEVTESRMDFPAFTLEVEGPYNDKRTVMNVSRYLRLVE